MRREPSLRSGSDRGWWVRPWVCWDYVVFFFWAGSTVLPQDVVPFSFCGFSSFFFVLLYAMRHFLFSFFVTVFGVILFPCLTFFFFPSLTLVSSRLFFFLFSFLPPAGC
eukprot:GCRY01008971.1.p1 GENE.GCRY01008971.1~~GCRY01008971.1.p1  ORF type:complete len:109 (+),score=13.95 GCRY01008971.1:367-693(+)